MDPCRNTSKFGARIHEFLGTRINMEFNILSWYIIIAFSSFLIKIFADKLK